MKTGLIVGFVLATFPLCAYSQSNPPTSAPAATLPTTAGLANSSKLAPTDANFVKAAAIGGMAEIQAGRLAARNGSASVKTLGQHMVMDHTKADDQLQVIAKAKALEVPTQMDPTEAATLAQLAKARGKAFDSQYLATELTDHQKTIALFQQEADQGSDPQLKSFAAQTLPTLQDHLRMVKDAMAKIGRQPGATG